MSSALKAERESHELRLRATARALSMVVDGELSRRASIAQVLAQSRWLDQGAAIEAEHLQHFEQLARRALGGLAGWIELRAPGRVLLDTRMPAGIHPSSTAAPALSNFAHVQPLSVGVDSHAALVEPVTRDGRVLLNIVITLKPVELQRFIDAQQLPQDWVGTVMDDRGTVVARHPGGAAFVGRGATADLRSQLARQREGPFRSVSLDGQPTVGYFHTSPRGWTYVGAMPSRQFAAALSQTTLQLVIGALVLLAMAVAGALWVSRRIVRPVRILEDAATRMQAGQSVQLGTTGVTEFDQVARALAQSAEVIQQGRIELEQRVAEAVERTSMAEKRVSHSRRVEALGRLTGGVAHDFNNLLGVISNSLHLIERHASSPALEVPIAATRRSVEAGSQLTQHLLRFAGRRPVQPLSLALQSWLPELIELLRSVLGRQIEAALQIDVDTAPVFVDAGELELALMNLAINARDAMPSGGHLRLTARNARPDECQDLRGSPAQRYVVLTVSDDGMGIEPEVAARAFEPFFTTKPVGQGTGLGLSQVHGLCSQAGGTARLDSTPGLGTTVSLILPAGQSAAEAAIKDAAPTAAIAGTRLLLVEDNDELAAVTTAMLREHGAVVQRVDSAADALRLLMLRPFFDVVLSDIVMPGGMDGLELARRIRREYPALRVVLISGYNSGPTNDEFLVLRKPCPPQELLQSIQNSRLDAGQAAG